jgi:transcriptional regulator NrdR family protein
MSNNGGMRCPRCEQSGGDRVVDSRMNDDKTVVRRRRLCLACGFRYTTQEKQPLLPVRSAASVWAGRDGAVWVRAL